MLVSYKPRPKQQIMPHRIKTSHGSANRRRDVRLRGRGAERLVCCIQRQNIRLEGEESKQDMLHDAAVVKDVIIE